MDRDKPRINSEYVDYDWLRSLPLDTVGGTYVNFLDTHVSGASIVSS